jgi:2-C-methyl-D-erythritol 4-phosphate cytidylyltransferase
MGAETPKQFLELGGVPLVIFTLRRLAACSAITHFYVATLPEEVAPLERRAAQEKLGRPVRVLRGGATRQESVARALEEVPAETEFVLVHDAVRPFVTREQIERVIAEAQACGAAILGVPATDTIKEVKRVGQSRANHSEDVALITATIRRERIVLAQTPQVFRSALLKEAFARAAADGATASDESMLVERLGQDVHVVHGSERNIKITRPADLQLARFYLEQEPGQG